MKVYLSTLACIILSFLSCGDNDEEKLFNLDFSGTYSYLVHISCFCHTDYVGPNKIVIVDGIVTKYNDNNVSTGDSNYDLVQSLGIDNLIQRAEEIIDRDPIMESVERHPTYGFISNCYFDINEQIADEEWGYTITDFEIL